MKTTLALLSGIAVGVLFTCFIGPLHDWRQIAIHDNGSWSYKKPLNISKESSVGTLTLQDARKELLDMGDHKQQIIHATFQIPVTKSKINCELKASNTNIEANSASFDGPNPYQLPNSKEGFRLVEFTFPYSASLDKAGFTVQVGSEAVAFDSIPL